MRRFLIFIFSLSLLSSKAFHNDPPDNGIKKFRGFYVNLFFPIIDYVKKPCTLNEPCNDDEELFNRTPFNVRTPNIGLGYIVRLQRFFVRTDVSFMYANKKIEYAYNFDAYNMGDQTSHGNLFESTMPSVGSKYFTINETYTGNINFYYLSINMGVGVALKKGFSIYTGWNINNLLKYNYDKSLDRFGEQYQVISNNTFNNTFQAVHVSDQTASFTKKEIAKRINQSLNTDMYLSLGVNRSFLLGSHLFFTEFQVDYHMFADKTQKHLISFKLGYVFKYSQDFKPST